MTDNKERGLYEKYFVERTDGKSLGECIVLELDDPNAWPALRVWADTVEAAGYSALAADVRTRVDRHLMFAYYEQEAKICDSGVIRDRQG